MDEFEFPSMHSHIREERSPTAGVDEWSDGEDTDQFFKSSPIDEYSDSSSSDDSSNEEPNENLNGSLAPSQQDDSESQSNSSNSDESLPQHLINLN